MSIRFRCKKCNQKYELDDDCSGDTVDCGRCHAPMLVPRESEIPPAAKEPPVPAEGIPAIEDQIQEIRIASSTAKNKASDDIIFHCKTCNQKYRLPSSAAGQTAECSRCKSQIVIPVHPENAPAGAASKAEVFFWCKFCGQQLAMPKELAGQAGACTKCGKAFEIPAEAEAKLSGILSRLRQEVSAKRDAPAKILTKTPAPPSEPPEPEAENSQTKTAINAIKYVLEVPPRNFFLIGCSLMIDLLMQTRLLHKMPRKLVVFLLVFTALLTTLMIYCGVEEIYQGKAKTPSQFNVMCANCNLCESRSIEDICAATCSKCKGPVGLQWKCSQCNGVFTRIEKSPVSCDKIDTLTPPACPFCSSTAVKYNSN